MNPSNRTSFLITTSSITSLRMFWFYYHTSVHCTLWYSPYRFYELVPLHNLIQQVQTKSLYNWTGRRYMPEDESIEEKWSKDPLGGVFFGVFLIVIAGIYIFRDQLPGEEWWYWIVVGIGCVFLVEALIRTTMTEYRRPVFGRIVLGIVLITIGAGLVYGIEDLFPYVIIIAGVLILLYYIRQSV